MTTNETAVNELSALINGRYKGVTVSLNANETHLMVETKTAKKANDISLDMARVGLKRTQATPPSPFSDSFVVIFELN